MGNKIEIFRPEKQEDWNLFELKPSDACYQTASDLASYTEILRANSLYIRHIEIYENNYSLEALSVLINSISNCPIVISLTLSSVTRSLDESSAIDFFSELNDRLEESFKELQCLELVHNLSLIHI